jgi:hypothetical protein
VLLIEEIELLHVDLWNTKAGSLEEPAASEPEATTELADDDLEGTLRSRLSMRLPRLRRGGAET